ncbi:hypothetical protein C9I98_08490 [Photobacterium sanctipauli]|uniref:Uncharacterized protein n=1 Tax=Photobacterium sanctipauli TaxID=1342794 RepID=A0A2T3NX34_9GAMM|nr:hypothetical protein [Photobacterium sanctipauli]PSW20863.1 hypothetical protein C9I98_08490 [Photobacterium sanctipauli]
MLPQLGTLDSEQYKNLCCSLYDAIPVLKKHSQCVLFPYGRSSLLFAWRHIDKIFTTQQQCPYIWLLAIDSDPRLSDKQFSNEFDTQWYDSTVPAAECVVLTRISQSSTGLTHHWFCYEGQTSDKPLGTAVSALFDRYQQSNSVDLHQFYAPYNGTDSLTAEWASMYHKLFPWVGEHTQIVMSGSFMGELGAGAGIYNLLHINERYQRGHYSGNTLQLESSEVVYRGAALYSWQE